MQSATLPAAKFSDPLVTAKGQERASVALEKLETLWFNTGTLCNIECRNCYIESSPTNDRLVYLTTAEVIGYLDEIATLGLGTREIGFTGGEPFMNPDLPQMLEVCLQRGFEVLLLTNAMRPMQRPRVLESLLQIRRRYGEHLSLRVSLDHHSALLHERERGPGSWESTLSGLRWLSHNGFRMSVAGRTCWGEPEQEARRGYGRLFAAEGFDIDPDDPGALVLFPEMDESVDVPEITVDCWDILGVSPSAMMCASSRMVIKRKGASEPTVLACTLLPYDPQFELGSSLEQALGSVRLNHPHCAKFCVLGGSSCSVAES